jgi:hypothetical protein
MKQAASSIVAVALTLAVTACGGAAAHSGERRGQTPTTMSTSAPCASPIDFRYVGPTGYGGRKYRYTSEGSTATLVLTPPHFDPYTASQAELTALDIPPRPPKSSPLYGFWKVHAAVTTSVLPTFCLGHARS